MKIHVDMNQLLQNAAYISQQRSSMQACMETSISCWMRWERSAGKDYDAFAQQLVAFRKDFDRMKQVLEDYAAYLRESASIYRRLQEECMTMARRLRY